MAAQRGALGVVTALLQHKAAVSPRTNTVGNTPLHFAAICGHHDIVRTLVTEWKAPVNKTNNDGYTPLHGACIHKKKETVKALRELGGDMDAENKDGKTPLDCLLEVPTPSIPNSSSPTPSSAIAAPPPSVTRSINSFLPPGISSPQQRLAAYQQLSAYLQRQSARAAQSSSSFPPPGSSFPRPSAVSQPPLAIQSSSPSTPPTPQSSSSSLSDTHLKYTTYLHRAAKRGHLDAMEKHVKNGTPVDTKNQKGNAPLHEAVLGKKCHVSVDALINHNANINLQNNGDGDTALHLAYKKGCDLCVEKLKGYGANTTITNKEGKVPSYYKKSTTDKGAEE